MATRTATDDGTVMTSAPAATSYPLVPPRWRVVGGCTARIGGGRVVHLLDGAVLAEDALGGASGVAALRAQGVKLDPVTA